MIEKWMTIEETSDYLRCGVRYLRDRIANKEIPYCRFGGKILINRERIDKWLLAQEVSPTQKESLSQEESQTESPKMDTKILPNCNNKEVDELIQKLIDFNEHFVTSLGNNLKKDLGKYNYKKLSDKTYAQLSRWCHPNRDTKREKETKPIAWQISEYLFGKVIDR